MSESLQPALSYWQPGVRRRLRLFFSHRWDHEKGLYDDAIAALERNPVVGSVQDMSVPIENRIQGPRGGNVSYHILLRDIACRIYTSDILIAPSRVGAGMDDWISWEIETAALCFSLPVLFVKETDQKYTTSLVTSIENAGAKVAVCGPKAPEIALNIVKLIMLPRDRGMVTDAAPTGPEYRGPLRSALQGMLRTHPFQPTL